MTTKQPRVRRIVWIVGLATGISLVGLMIFHFSRRLAAHHSLFARQQTSLFQITSNSMAPAMIGPHYPARCHRCQQAWVLAAETIKNSRGFACPSCEREECKIGQLTPGKVVQVSPMHQGKVYSGIRRLDSIVFIDPAEEVPSPFDQDYSPSLHRWTCKRVWGLPGEKVALQGGQLWIDGKMYQKSLEELKKVAVLVSDFPLDSAVHWRMHPTGSPAEAVPPRNEFTLEAGWQVSWNYQSIFHQQSSPTQPHPVLDDYWCNHATSRSLLPVNDLLLTIDFLRAGETAADFRAEARVIIQVDYLGTSHTLECLFDNSAEAYIGTSSVLVSNPSRLQIGGWDGQAWAQWDKEPARLLSLEVSTAPWIEPNSSSLDRTTGFSLRTLKGAVRIGRMRVDRDLALRYDDRDPTNGEPEPTKLGQDEFYVIGDNLPISRDSRNGLGKIHRSQMIGIVEDSPKF